jgi:hypothetical protein
LLRNSGENSKFRQTGRGQRPFSRKKHCKFSWLAEIGAATGTASNTNGPGD